MDKKKIISSLTLAGMLATTVAGSGVFAAETSDPATKALGEYSKLITGKVAVPFILQSEADRVTGKDVKASFKNAATFTFNSTALTDDQVLATGDVVYINGEARTIVIYGDTNCDGKINIMDAVTTLNHVKGKAELTGAAFAAADLNNNGDINILEAVGALNVVKGKAEYENIATAPKAEVSVLKDVEISSSGIKLSFDMNPEGYSYKLAKEDGTRISGTIITGATKNTESGLYEKTISATLTDKDKYSVSILDKDGKEVATKTFTYRQLNNVNSIDVGNGIGSENVKAFCAKVEIKPTTVTPTPTPTANSVATTIKATLYSVADTKNTVETTANLPANTVAAELNFGDVSKLKDGALRMDVVVMDADGNVSDTFSNTTTTPPITITKAVTAPTVFVEATRSATDSANVTIKTTASKAYIVAKKANETAPTVDELKESKITYTTFTDPIPVAITADAQKVYVLGVNLQGTPSEIAVADVASSTAVPLKKVGTPVIDSKGIATWTDTNTKEVTGYQVRIVKGENVIAEKEVKEAKYDISSIAKENGAGSYTVQVRANGNNTTTANSAYRDESSAYRIEALTLTEPTFTNGIVEWNQTQAKAADKVIVKLYKVTKMSNNSISDKKLVKEETRENNTYSYDMTSAMKAEGNGTYVATVTLKAKADKPEVDSAERDATGIYYIAPAVTNVKATATDDKVTIRFKPINDIVGLSEIYALSYVATEANGNTSTGTLNSISNADAFSTPSDENDKREFVISPASSSTKYEFSIVTMVKVGEKEGKPVYKELAETTPTMDVSTSATLIKSNTSDPVTYTIKDATSLSVANDLAINADGELMIYNGTAAENKNEAPNAEEIKAVINMLKVGDKISIDNKGKVSAIELNASATVSRIVNLGTSLKDIALTINANDKFNTIVNGTVKSVKVKGENGVADLAGLTVSDGVTVAIKDSSNTEVLADGQNVTVKAGTKVTIPAEATVTLNGVTLTTGTATGTDVAITLTANSNDELTIDGRGTAITLTADANKTVNFKGKQSGTVTVANAAKKATLTLKTLDDSSSLAKSSITNLTINSANTTVNIVDVNMTGTLNGTQGTIVSDATIVDGVDENVKITPVHIGDTATVKFEYDKSKGSKITDITGNVKVEIKNHGKFKDVAENTDLVSDIKDTSSTTVVTVNEGVNATYGVNSDVITINLTAGTITL